MTDDFAETVALSNESDHNGAVSRGQLAGYLHVSLPDTVQWRYRGHNGVNGDEHMICVEGLSLRDVEGYCPWLDVVDVFDCDPNDDGLTFVVAVRDTVACR